MSLIPGFGGSPGEGNGNPLLYSCLENFHGQKNLVVYRPRVLVVYSTQRVGHNWVTEHTQLAVPLGCSNWVLNWKHRIFNRTFHLMQSQSSNFLLPHFLNSQLVKNPPAMQETQVWVLGQEDPLEEEQATFTILAWRIPWMYGPWVCKEFYMTEQLSLSLSLPQGGQNCLLYISFSQLPFFFFFWLLSYSVTLLFGFL